MKEGTRIGKKEFAIFKAECRRWIDLLSLSDWKIYYRFYQIEDGLAGINRDYEGKIATVSLSPFQERCSRSEVNVKSSARHEILHLLLGELDYLNGRRLVTSGSWDAAEHTVIRRLEALLNGIDR